MMCRRIEFNRRKKHFLILISDLCWFRIKGVLHVVSSITKIVAVFIPSFLSFPIWSMLLHNQNNNCTSLNQYLALHELNCGTTTCFRDFNDFMIYFVHFCCENHCSFEHAHSIDSMHWMFLKFWEFWNSCAISYQKALQHADANTVVK